MSKLNLLSRILTSTEDRLELLSHQYLGQQVGKSILVFTDAGSGVALKALLGPRSCVSVHDQPESCGAPQTTSPNLAYEPNRRCGSDLLNNPILVHSPLEALQYSVPLGLLPLTLQTWHVQ